MLMGFRPADWRLQSDVMPDFGLSLQVSEPKWTGCGEAQARTCGPDRKAPCPPCRYAPTLLASSVVGLGTGSGASSVP